MSAFSEDIKRLVSENPGQMIVSEYTRIANILERLQPCNFLSFSTGKDVPLWTSINKGTNVFLEHDERWVEKTRELCPDARVHKITYTTVIKRANEYYADPSLLKIMDLPEYIRETAWDVIFIDGPTGFNEYCPGRFQSIWESSKLGAKHVFIHDINRMVEKTCADKFLAHYKNSIVIDRLLHLY